MSTRYYWIILALIVLLDTFGDTLVPTASWNEVPLVTDMVLYFIAGLAILIIEIRQTATWVVEQIKGTDSTDVN